MILELFGNPATNQGWAIWGLFLTGVLFIYGLIKYGMYLARKKSEKKNPNY